MSDEFKSYRDELRSNLDRHNISVKIQDDFIATGTETLDKLDTYIISCDAIIHLAGEGTGKSPTEGEAQQILERYADLFVRLPELKPPFAAGKSPFSFTQWEAYLALYHKKPLFICIRSSLAKKESGFSSDDIQLVRQQAHMDRLNGSGRYPEIHFRSAENLSLQIYRSSILEILNRSPNFNLSQKRRRRFGENQFDEIKDLLLNEAKRLRDEGFIENAFTQITGSIERHMARSRKSDAVLLDRMAERESEHDFLMLVYLCAGRARDVGLDELCINLEDWMNTALDECGLTLQQVKGHEGCQDALDFLDVHAPPRPTLEIAWKAAPEDPENKVIPEAFFRWGRCRIRLSVPSAQPQALGQVVKNYVEAFDSSPDLQSIPISRLDVFVTQNDLNRPWEYLYNSGEESSDRELHPWPTVLRIQRKPRERKSLTAPPHTFERNVIACLVGDCDEYLPSVREKGAFFAAWQGLEPVDEGMLWKIATHAGVGVWLRNINPSCSVDELLSKVDGIPVVKFPNHVHELRSSAPQDSDWRDVSILFDLPDLPSFRFSEESTETESELRHLNGLT